MSFQRQTLPGGWSQNAPRDHRQRPVRHRPLGRRRDDDSRGGQTPGDADLIAAAVAGPVASCGDDLRLPCFGQDGRAEEPAGKRCRGAVHQDADAVAGVSADCDPIGVDHCAVERRGDLHRRSGAVDRERGGERHGVSHGIRGDRRDREAAVVDESGAGSERSGGPLRGRELRGHLDIGGARAQDGRNRPVEERSGLNGLPVVEDIDRRSARADGDGVGNVLRVPGAVRDMKRQRVRSLGEDDAGNVEGVRRVGRCSERGSHERDRGRLAGMALNGRGHRAGGRAWRWDQAGQRRGGAVDHELESLLGAAARAIGGNRAHGVCPLGLDRRAGNVRGAVERQGEVNVGIGIGRAGEESHGTSDDSRGEQSSPFANGEHGRRSVDVQGEGRSRRVADGIGRGDCDELNALRDARHGGGP